ncbi:MAG: translation initiation factor IF-2 [Patescibacteria group bacterium]
MENKADKKILVERPPVIAIMGHIDHGKSSLLDYIRKTNIVETESGGITQHISAYEVVHKTANGKEKRITFLDTPGHEAFGMLRVRGAQVADIAVLVVSGEDGVKPQTKEVLQAILDAKIPYIVAITKIDKPGADVIKVKGSLAENEVYVEGYGGAIPCVALSSKTGEGVSDLLDMVLLVAELEELKGNPSIPAQGIVLENSLDRKKGISATLIIKDGVLKTGMFIVAEKSLSSVRIMEDCMGRGITEMQFGSPVRIIGWDSAPQVGSAFLSFNSKKEAEEYVENFNPQEKKKTGVEDLRFAIPVIIEADTSGSLEAVVAKIEAMENERAKFKIIHQGIGVVSEGDLKLAQAHPNAVIVGFHTSLDSVASDLSIRLHIPVSIFTVVYDLTDFMQNMLQEKTPKIKTEEVAARLKILKIFSTEKNRQIVGGRVEEGEVKSGKEFRIMRRGVALGEGVIKEVQKLKNKVPSASTGEECGLLAESKIEIAPGDFLEVYVIVEK